MRAVLLEKPGDAQSLCIGELPDPAPQAGEVLIRIEAAGVCSHDIAMRRGILKRGIMWPLILGHEISGTVLEIGAGVRRFRPGDRVASTQRRHVCGMCSSCMAGEETYCDELQFIGHGLPCGGGYAELIAIGQENLCHVPEGVSISAASIAACAIGSSFNAVRDVAKVRPGDTVLVTGASGGLGVHALQIARLCGAVTLAVTSDPSKQSFLEAAGADVVIGYKRGTDFSESVRSATGGRGVDVVIDNVGTPVFQACRSSLAKRGRWVLVGELAGDFVPFNPAQLILSGLSMLTVHSSSRKHLEDVLQLLNADKLHGVIDSELPLQEAAEAHRLVESGLTAGRVVLKP